MSKTLHQIKSATPTYKSWSSMMQRCYNSNNPSYHDYGGRGIVVCSRWHDFKMFFNDMGERPQNLSIERINNNLGYKPANCKWGTRQEQNNNTRRNRRITSAGETLTIAQWAERLDIDADTIYTRLFRGVPAASVLQPVWSVRKLRDKASYAHGEALGKSAKLTRCKAEFIRVVCAIGAKPKMIAPLFGISHWNVYDILRGRSWR